MLDVLMYMFEHDMGESAILTADQDQDALKTHLSQAGFSHQEIRQAFSWLAGLDQHQNQQKNLPAQANKNSIRLFNWQESQRLDQECRGYLHFLEQCGILNPSTRELVIDRVLALNDDDIDLEQLKWVILMVLFKQSPQDDGADGWMEDLIFSEPAASIH